MLLRMADSKRVSEVYWGDAGVVSVGEVEVEEVDGEDGEVVVVGAAAV